jgi:hypothetical protein
MPVVVAAVEQLVVLEVTVVAETVEMLVLLLTALQEHLPPVAVVAAEERMMDPLVVQVSL